MVKTFCQALVAVLGASGAGLISASGTGSLSTAALASLLSILTSIGSVIAPLGTPLSPSLVNTFPELYPRPRMCEICIPLTVANPISDRRLP